MPAFPDKLETEHLFDAFIDLAPPEDVGPVPAGRRSIHIVKGGTVEGPKLRGAVRPGGGDWLMSYAGFNELDVRGTFETDDGALIYVSYRGVLKVDPAVGVRVMSGEDVAPSEYYFRTTPRLETGSEKYAWLNSTVCVAYGWFAPRKVAYRLFAIK